MAIKTNCKDFTNQDYFDGLLSKDINKKEQILTCLFLNSEQFITDVFNQVRKPGYEKEDYKDVEDARMNALLTVKRKVESGLFKPDKINILTRLKKEIQYKFLELKKKNAERMGKDFNYTYLKEIWDKENEIENAEENRRRNRRYELMWETIGEMKNCTSILTYWYKIKKDLKDYAEANNLSYGYARNKIVKCREKLIEIIKHNPEFKNLL